MVLDIFKDFSRKNLICSLLGAMLVWSTCAYSEFHGALTATTNYVWRGYSKSSDHFSYNANLDYEHDTGFFIGTTASRVDFGDQGFGDRAQFEIVPYLGWSTDLGDKWRIDLQWSRYFYDGNVFGEFSDYNEFYGFLHYDDMISARIAFSEDLYHREHSAVDFEISGRYSLTDWLEFSAGTGYSLAKKAIEYDYLYWNAGLSAYYKYVVVDLRYMDALETASEHHWGSGSGADAYPETLNSTLVFSFSIGF